MEKNQGFFDPYNFNIPQNNMNMNQQMPNQMASDMSLGLDNIANPAMYYEQQYMYYRYLTQVLEYKIKLREWENMNREQKQSK
ncbi:MAG: hypothetical protein Q4D02_05145 [Clostridia bacterium]|nr:hypothetical protein [Clostridia bacterium]